MKLPTTAAEFQDGQRLLSYISAWVFPHLTVIRKLTCLLLACLQLTVRPDHSGTIIGRLEVL